MLEKFRSHFIVILSFAIVLAELWVVHYHYTGPVATLNGVQYVTKSSNSYPKFSDEWVAAGLAKYAIEHKALPTVNFLDNNKPHPNFLIFFHSIVALFFGIFHLDPVYNFSIAVILSGIFISFSVYYFLRSLGFDKTVSCLPVLLLPFINQSGNLPGMWFLLPFMLSLSFFFLQLSAMVKKEHKLAAVWAGISLLIYPPMVVFTIASYLSYGKKFKKEYLGIIAIAFAAVGITAVMAYFFGGVRIVKLALDSLIRPNLDKGIASYPIWYVIPFVLFPFIIGGIIEAYRKKCKVILYPLIIGSCYWILYLFYPQVIIIEFPRIVMITSILLITTSAFGFNLFKKELKQPKIIAPLMVVFVGIAIFYPIENGWENFSFKSFNSSIIMVSPPISYELTSDDVNLFQDIKNVTFIAPPWKGLVLGVLTNSNPLESKPSTVAIMKLPYEVFMESSCEDKRAYVQKYAVKYVYSAKIDCPGFIFLGESQEKLKLYKTEEEISD